MMMRDRLIATRLARLTFTTAGHKCLVGSPKDGPNNAIPSLLAAILEYYLFGDKVDQMSKAFFEIQQQVTVVVADADGNDPAPKVQLVLEISGQQVVDANI